MLVCKSLYLMFVTLTMLVATVAVVNGDCPKPVIENGELAGESKDSYSIMEMVEYKCNFRYTISGRYGIMACVGTTWFKTIACGACSASTFYTIPTYQIIDRQFNATNGTCDSVCDQEPDCMGATFHDGYCYRSFFIRSLYASYTECENACYNDDNCKEMVSDLIVCHLYSKKFNSNHYYFASGCV